MAQVDYGQEMLDRIPRRSKMHKEGNEGNILLRDVFGHALELVEENLFSASDMRFLENAQGKYLDYWGQLLKIPRSLGQGKVNLLEGNPVWDNISSGSDILGTIQGVAGGAGANVESSLDWAAKGVRSFITAFTGVNPEEALFFVTQTSYILPVQQGDFREVSMVIRGMPQLVNYAEDNVATATNSSGGDLLRFYRGSSVTTEHFIGTRAVKKDPTTNTIEFVSFIPKFSDYTICVWVKTTNGSTFRVNKLNGPLYEVIGTGGWQLVKYPTPLYWAEEFKISNYSHEIYLGAVAIVEGTELYGVPNPSTGVLEQKIRLKIDGRNNAGASIESVITNETISDTPKRVNINRTFTNPTTAMMSWRVQNALIPNPIQFYVDQVTVDDGQLYQNWDDTTYRQKLLAVNSGITIAVIRDTLSKILECEPDDITIVNNPTPKTVDISLPWGSDITLIEALIDDMLLPSVTANISEI